MQNRVFDKKEVENSTSFFMLFIFQTFTQIKRKKNGKTRT